MVMLEKVSFCLHNEFCETFSEITFDIEISSQKWFPFSRGKYDKLVPQVTIINTK